jgi:hypothetical protein
VRHAELALALQCPECCAELAARGLNESQQIACCTRCGKVLDLAQPRRPALAVVPPPAPPRQPPVRRRVEQPQHMDLSEGHGEVTVTWRRLLNRVRVLVTRDALEIRSWFRAKRFSRSDVHHLFVESRQVPNKDGEAESESFVLSALVGPELRRVELVKDLGERDEALWLEEALEHALRIHHAPVGGELDC